MRGYAITALAIAFAGLVAGAVVNLWLSGPWEAAGVVAVVGTITMLATERFWNPHSS